MSHNAAAPWCGHHRKRAYNHTKTMMTKMVVFMTTIKIELHTKTLMTKRLSMILMMRMQNKIHAETIVAIMMMTLKFKLHAKTMTSKMMMMMMMITTKIGIMQKH